QNPIVLGFSSPGSRVISCPFQYKFNAFYHTKTVVITGFVQYPTQYMKCNIRFTSDYNNKEKTDMKISNNKELSREQREELLKTLKTCFEKNMNCHIRLEWTNDQAKLEANHEKLWLMNEMEKTGGEPDVVDDDKKKDEYIFYVCSAESPKGRRIVC